MIDDDNDLVDDDACTSVWCEVASAKESDWSASTGSCTGATDATATGCQYGWWWTDTSAWYPENCCVHARWQSQHQRWATTTTTTIAILSLSCSNINQCGAIYTHATATVWELCRWLTVMWAWWHHFDDDKRRRRGRQWGPLSWSEAIAANESHMSGLIGSWMFATNIDASDNLFHRQWDSPCASARLHDCWER
jgi:hypothetical protein